MTRWRLVTAIAALGIKATPAELMGLGWTPLRMIVAETRFLALLVLIALLLGG